MDLKESKLYNIAGNKNSSKAGKKTPASNRRHHNRVLVALGFCTERSVRDISHLTGHVCEGKKGVLILMHSNHLGKTYGSILTESCLEGS